MKRVIKKSSAADNILIGQALNEFMEVKEAANLSDATLKDYRASIDYCLGKMGLTYEDEMKELTEGVFIKFINYMRHEDVSKNYINHLIRNIRMFAYFGMEKEWIEPYKVKQIERQEELVKYLSDEEIAALLEKPARNASFVEWRTYAFVSFMLATGARPATVCDIKISDIDFLHKEVNYRHMKTKQAMIAPISQALDNVLREYIRMWRNGVIDGYLFPNIGDEKATVSSIHQAYKRYCQNRGVEQSNIYALRHTFARGFILNGGSPFALQKLLGHSTLDMTRRYIALFSRDIARDLEAFTVLDTMKKPKSRRNLIEKK